MPSFYILQVKYKEAYELTKAKSYQLDPDGVNFVNIRKANQVTNEVRQTFCIRSKMPYEYKEHSLQIFSIFFFTVYLFIIIF